MTKWAFRTLSLSESCTEGPKGQGLGLYQQSLCSRLKDLEHLNLNSCLEGRWIKTDRVTCSRSEFVAETKVERYLTKQSRVSGQRWICGLSQIGLARPYLSRWALLCRTRGAVNAP